MEIVIDRNIGDFNIIDDTIVYENLDMDGRLFKIGIDGNNPVQLTDNHYNI